MKNIIILTGPGGSGKTTLAEMLVKRQGYTLIDGDHEDTEFFPKGGQWLSKNSSDLKKAHAKILHKAKELTACNKKVVIDYIIFGQYFEFFDNFKKEFGDNLEIIILLPDRSEIIARDRDRECWTTGEERISTVYSEFQEVKDIVGAEHYINTSNQSPEETFKQYFS